MAKVLIVDDDPHMRELVRLFLGPEGFEIEKHLMVLKHWQL